jgi:NitT/TauT family transport system ATP-binding protein
VSQSTVGLRQPVTGMAGPAALVELSSVRKLFDNLIAVDGISFQIMDNEFVSIVGPSGCGKSTLLRMVAGLIAPSGGAIRLRDQQLEGPARDVGMVFQSPVLLPWRTALENVLFVAEMRGARRRTYRARALDLLRLAGLAGFENRMPYELSGGMQQRVAICRALLLNPSIILMDEPFGALDIITRERMGFELQKIWSASRSTVLFVTHSITEATLLSDRILVMSAHPGRLVEVVPVDLPRPRERRTLTSPRFIEITAHVSETVAGGWVE